MIDTIAAQIFISSIFYFNNKMCQLFVALFVRAGVSACRVYGFFGGLSGTVSITTLAAISIDRYYVIVYPLALGSKKLRALLMIVCVWCYSLFFALLPALDIGFSRYSPEGFLTSCSFDYLDRTLMARVFMFTFFVCAWLLPLIVIVYCYMHIMGSVHATDRLQSNKTRNKMELKLALGVINVILLWFVAWTPYSIVALIGITGHEEYLAPLGSMLPAMFCKTSACINPYLYSMTHPRFKTEIQRFFCGLIGREPSQFRTMSGSKPVFCISGRRRITTLTYSVDYEMKEMK